MAILRLPGGTPLSGFRLEKLNAALAQAAPAWHVVAARHWHFVELEEAEAAFELGSHVQPGVSMVAQCSSFPH